MSRFTHFGGDEPGTPGPEGPVGPQGPAGADGAPGADGADALWNFLGEWQNGIDYAAGSVVQFQGSSYYHPNGQFSSYGPPGYGWLLVSAKGDAGADGVDGADGADGSDGTNGANGADGSPGLVYLGNYISGNGYIANIAVVKGSDNNLYIATSSGGLGDPVGNSAEWSIFLPKGADGSQGEPGPQGDPGTAGGFGASASFYSTVDQGPHAANSIQAFTFNSTDWATGITLGGTSQITMTNAGKYNIAFSAQLHQTQSSGITNIWLNKNGTPEPYTNTKVSITANNPYYVAAWNLFVDAAAGDYYQLMWSSTSEHTVIEQEAATGSGATLHPEVPSIILTVNQVG